MKKGVIRQIFLISILFTSAVLIGCASTGSTKSIEEVKTSLNASVNGDVTWTDDFNVKSYKNFYTEEYAFYKTPKSIFGNYSMLLCGRLFTVPTTSMNIKNHLFFDTDQPDIIKDIRTLKKGDIFVSPISNSDEKYIYLIKLNNKYEIRTNPTGSITISGTVIYPNRYDGWGYQTSSGFEEINHYDGLVGLPLRPLFDNSIIIYPWVNIDKKEVTYLILDLTNKCAHEFDLKFLGSFKE